MIKLPRKLFKIRTCPYHKVPLEQDNGGNTWTCPECTYWEYDWD